MHSFEKFEHMVIFVVIKFSSVINLIYVIVFYYTFWIASLVFPAEGWPMPFAAPNAMVPVRLELRGSYNNNQTRFHAVGDYVNFLPTPPTNLDNVQVRSEQNV